MLPRLRGATWVWASSGLSGHGLPQHLGTALTSWALCCVLEAWPAQCGPWVLGRGLGSCRISHPAHPTHTPRWGTLGRFHMSGTGTGTGWMRGGGGAAGEGVAPSRCWRSQEVAGLLGRPLTLGFFLVSSPPQCSFVVSNGFPVLVTCLALPST